MPQNDLRRFEYLDEPYPMIPGATGFTAQSATEWPDAVRRLWLTPRPRVIVVLGDVAPFRFLVVGGEGLKVTRDPAAKEQRQVFRLVDDDPEARQQLEGMS
jgi:uracil-DNA glycosylase